MDNNHVLYVRLRTKFVRICTLLNSVVNVNS